MPSFLVDENLPRQLVHRARDHGHEARWVRSVMPGASDREILNELLSSGEHRVTRDIRFTNTIFARIGMEEDLPGVVVIWMQRMMRVRAAWRRYVERDALPATMVVLEVPPFFRRRLLVATTRVEREPLP